MGMYLYQIHVTVWLNYHHILASWTEIFLNYKKFDCMLLWLIEGTVLLAIFSHLFVFGAYLFHVLFFSEVQMLKRLLKITYDIAFTIPCHFFIL
jgi:hypothetical protein